MEFKRIVNVIPLVRVSLTGTQIFSYTVPLKLEGQIRQGMLLAVPFGGRKIDGLSSSGEMPRLASEVKNFRAILDIRSKTVLLDDKGFVLANWLSEYYTSPLGVVMKAMLPKPAKKTSAPPAAADTQKKSNPDFVLTEHQRQAVTQISTALGTNKAFLLHGITGSGKTEVYMQVIDRVLEQGGQALVLVPEISLTPQAVERFSQRFSAAKIAFLHSRLKLSEKAWMRSRIRAGEARVIIGPRSAVFAPFQKLGIIVIDEEHDSSYKQYDQNPKYHARTVAKKLSEIWNCPLVAGDATPSVESFYEAESGKVALLELPHRIKADVGLPTIKIVDMRKEDTSRGIPIFSEYLKYEILLNLQNNKQIILFLNRRGSANSIVCTDCGQALICQHCSVSLVWHNGQGKLLCHHCGRSYPQPIVCPHCESINLRHFGFGTQAVEDELKTFLHEEFKAEMPEIRRMDRDTTTAPDGHSKLYRDFASGKTRILIGTKMITKGWDISTVGLVGIVSADTALHLPDFRTNEKVLQMLVQVAGRAGRGKEAGMVVLQTLSPDNAAIAAARLHDYKSFYKKEIEERRQYSYPPFSKLVKLRFADANPKKAQKKADDARRLLEQKNDFPVEILGPLPAFISRLRGKYQYYIFLKVPAGRNRELYDYLKTLPASADIDVDPESLL